MKPMVFFKGILMGICDLVPGISGGTIAFITGIYERLIGNIKKILRFAAIYEILIMTFSFNLNKIKKVYLKYDLYFLFSLFLGIVVAILMGSRIILYLLEKFFVFTMSFFVGLILASSLLIYKKIDDHKIIDRLFGLFGFLFGLVFLIFAPIDPEIGYFYIFVSGFIGIIALFLPGISGSYILYLLGTYKYMLNSIKDFSFVVILVFLSGAALGAVFISNIVSFFLKKFHSKTLYFLFGFIIGALFIPVRDILSEGLSGFDVIVSILLSCIGVLIVSVVHLFSVRKRTFK